MIDFDRRRVLAMLAASSAGGLVPGAASAARSPVPSIYAALPGEPHPVPAMAPGTVPSRFWRTTVPLDTAERPGTVIVDPRSKHLYLIQPGGSAIRYGIGAGRAGFEWSGRAVVGRKKAWPVWTPPADMIAREPWLAPYRNGFPAGPENPLGARAFYLHRNGRDTLYRIHGTHQPWSIGKAISSGCIRMLNHDVIDLYARVPIGAPVVVMAWKEPQRVQPRRVRRAVRTPRGASRDAARNGLY